MNTFANYSIKSNMAECEMYIKLYFYPSVLYYSGRVKKKS